MTLPPMPRPPAARDVLRRIRAESATSRLLVTITGPGGTGKTPLLAELSEAFSSVGVQVHSSIEEPRAADGAEVVLLDDAHTMSEDELARIEELVRFEATHVVLARRPWPQSAGMRCLIASMPDSRVEVVLGPLAAEEIATYAASALGRRLPEGRAAEVARVTGGMPWLVRRILRAWMTGGDAADTALAPDSVLDALADDLAGLDTEIRELVLEVALGFDPAGHVPPPVLVHDADPDLVARARAEGVIDRDARPTPILADAAVAAAPPHQVTRLRLDLLDRLAALGLPIDVAPARAMADAGLRHPLLVCTLLGAGDRVASAQPHLALEYYREAVAAGAEESGVVGRRARTLLAAGELDAAAQTVDAILRGSDSPARDRNMAADVAACLWARRGMLHRAADVYRWLGATGAPQPLPQVIVTLLGLGDLRGAEELLGPEDERSPTDLAVSLRLMAEGLHESIVGDAARAQATLVRASDTLNGLRATPPLPELPAVIAASVAMGVGNVTVASTVLDDAIRAGQGGPAAKAGLLVWRAWSAMLHDDQPHAVSALAEARSHTLRGRDVCLAAALEVGMARRTYDPALIRSTWRRAGPHLLRWPRDLFAIAPLAELLMAAARCEEDEALTTHLRDAWALLDSLGEPAPWSVPLRWGSLQAAVLTHRAADLPSHVAALAAAAPVNRLAAAMAPAGQAWATVLERTFDVDLVEEAAAGLARAGLAWDGARLVSHAATRAVIRKDQARLLATARDLRPARPAPGPPDPEPAAPAHQPDRSISGTDVDPPPASTGTPLLSDREREVAALLVAGRTYREIGAALFMSPRTAEHHVARIRRRLGASSRAELLVRLRTEPREDASRPT